MRRDGLLPIEYEVGPDESEITGLAGLLPCVDLACVLGVPSSVDRHVEICGSQGWLDRQPVLALILLNLAGGECVDDIDTLEADAGACSVFRTAERFGMSRPQRAALDRRFRKGRSRSFPSPTRLHEYLEEFHDASEAAKSVQGSAYIPAKNEHLAGLVRVNADIVSATASHRPEKVATLDIDATLQETTRKEALFCYEKYRAFQPLTALWFETGMVVHSEFRDGNVPAGFEMLRFLRETLSMLPSSVEKVRVRMDSAGYQHDVLRFCATGDRGSRDVIEFTVSCDVTHAFRQAVAEVPEEEWRALPGKRSEPIQEWAEVVFVPNATATGKHEPYRYIAIREAQRQGVLPGMDGGDEQLSLPHLPVVMGSRAYRVKGIVTNMAGEGAELIKYHRQRCGKGEEVQSVLKCDLAGGNLPSKRFGANAAWWAIVILAYNLHAAMRRLVYGHKLTTKRMKAIRFALINVPAMIVHHARQVSFRLSRMHPAYALLSAFRSRIAALAPAPS